MGFLCPRKQKKTKEGEGETIKEKKALSVKNKRNKTLVAYLVFVVVFVENRDREMLLNQADDPTISTEEANKLRGKSVSITFDDVSVCINVSFIWQISCYNILSLRKTI